MKIRSIFFWSHLAAGVLAGLIILTMSITGVLLTYERQIIDRAEQSYKMDTPTNQSILSADELLAIAGKSAPDQQRFTITYKNDFDAIVQVSAGRGQAMLLDPHTGEIVYEGATSAEKFFTVVTRVHRWLALSGDSRQTGKAITGYSNLLFLYLLLSGIYLWLPRAWKWAIVKSKIFFNPKTRNSKARDYNWHHVFAFWSVIPLLVIITTASVFSFPWANQLLYSVFGEEVPERGRRNASTEVATAVDYVRTNEELLSLAMNELDRRGISDWKSISFEAAVTAHEPAAFRIDRSVGGQPDAVYNLKLDSATGGVVEWRSFADKTPGSRARNNVRFLHTGEVFGFIGQTVAGLASLAASIMVWTGLALAWRRLILPLIRRRQIGRAMTT